MNNNLTTITMQYEFIFPENVFYFTSHTLSLQYSANCLLIDWLAIQTMRLLYGGGTRHAQFVQVQLQALITHKCVTCVFTHRLNLWG